MEQTFQRTRELQAFRLDIPALDAFCTKIAAELGERVTLHLDITLPDRHINTDDFEELAAAKDLPPSVTQFRLAIFDDTMQRRFTLQTYRQSDTEIRVEGPTEAWCAGVIEVAATTLAQYRTWYAWLRTDVAAGLIGLPIAAAFVAATVWQGWQNEITGIALGLLFVALLAAKHSLLTPAVLQLRPGRTFLDKYGGALTLTLAALSFLASAVQVIQTYLGSGK
jgi:hypothetical protein